MSDHLTAFWDWAKTAPLPVVLALTLVLGGWVWTLATNQRVDEANVAAVGKQVDSMDAKLDRIISTQADISAEQRQIRYELRTSKEK